MLRQLPKPRTAARKANVPAPGDTGQIPLRCSKNAKEPEKPDESHVHEAPPPSIAADERKAQLWETATEDERFLAQELCELHTRSHTSIIENYLNFADVWHARFRKEKHGKYKRDMQFVKKGAAMSPYSVSQVYCILRTVNVYPRDAYEKLAVQASEHFVTISWTHLRTIADKLGKSEFRDARRRVERKLVTEQMTEPKLKELIEQEVPEAAGSTETQNPQKVIRTFITSFRKNVNQYQGWQGILEGFKISGDPKADQEMISQVKEALRLLDQTSHFINESRPLLKKLAKSPFEHGSVPDGSAADTERIARRVREKIDADKERPEEMKRQRDRGFALSGEFAGDMQVPKNVKMDRRDDDDFSESAAEDDDDEFDNLYDADMPGDDDEDEFPDIFDEMGKIPDFPAKKQ
jgi:hypothetical protein